MGREASQEPDLKRWAEAFADLPVKWYHDKATGKTMDRPGWKRLEADTSETVRKCHPKQARGVTQKLTKGTASKELRRSRKRTAMIAVARASGAIQ